VTFCRFAIVVVLGFVFGAPAAARATRQRADPLVHVVIHVMLTMPQPLPGTSGPWYCERRRAHADVPTPEGVIRSLERELRGYGTVADHFGFGTWTVGSAPSAEVAFEEGDHVEVVTHLSTARRFLPPFLHRLRVELNQREALGEIFGGAYGAPQQRRTRIEVTLPPARADFATIAGVHRIFGDSGHGGATQIEDEGGVHIYTGATSIAGPRIESALRRAHLAYSVEQETFFTDDAPPCAAAHE
jgi:hypothetical protein